MLGMDFLYDDYRDIANMQSISQYPEQLALQILKTQQESNMFKRFSHRTITQLLVERSVNEWTHIAVSSIL